MPRPQKFNIEYFYHDNSMRNDPKIRSVRAKFGNEGYSIYNMLLETLAEANLLCILSNDLQLEIMAGDFGIGSKKLKEILKYFEKVDLIKIEKGYIYCPQFDKRAKMVFDKRNVLLSSLRRMYGITVTETGVSVDNRDSYTRREEKRSKKKRSEEKRYTPQDLFDVYQKLNKNLLGIDKLTADRKLKCRTRLKDDRFYDDFCEAVKKAQSVSFLCGVNEREWKAGFDFMIKNGTNVYKVLEGFYDGRKKGKGKRPKFIRRRDEKTGEAIL